MKKMDVTVTFSMTPDSKLAVTKLLRSLQKLAIKSTFKCNFDSASYCINEIEKEKLIKSNDKVDDKMSETNLSDSEAKEIKNVKSANNQSLSVVQKKQNKDANSSNHFDSTSSQKRPNGIENLVKSNDNIGKKDKERSLIVDQDKEIKDVNITNNFHPSAVSTPNDVKRKPVIPQLLKRKTVHSKANLNKNSKSKTIEVIDLDDEVSKVSLKTFEDEMINTLIEENDADGTFKVMDQESKDPLELDESKGGALPKGANHSQSIDTLLKEFKTKDLSNDNVNAESNDKHENEEKVIKIRNKLPKCLKMVYESGNNNSTIKEPQKAKESNKKEYKCDSCEKCFQGSDSLWYHIQHVHKGVRNIKFTSEPCDMCGKLVKDVVFHKRYHHDETPIEIRPNQPSEDEEKKKFHCEVCDKPFENTKSLIEHKYRTHGVASLKHKCLTCHKTFSTKMQLEEHRKINHQKKEDHVCKTCGRKFLKQSKLLEHTKVHLKPKKDC